MRNPFKQIYCENCEYYMPAMSEPYESPKCSKSISTHNRHTQHSGVEYSLCSVVRLFDMPFCLKAKEKVQENRK